MIVYMMDVSGSMGDEQKEIDARIESFWIGRVATRNNTRASRAALHHPRRRGPGRSTAKPSFTLVKAEAR